MNNDTMNLKKELFNNIDNVHTTQLGIDRIRNNIDLDDSIDVVEHCKDIIKDEESQVTKKGKNYYVTYKNVILTINSSSFTIITAHKKK